MASRRNRIKIFYPDYDPRELLLMLPADDGPEHNKIPYFVVNDVVHAFANHPSEGWLSRLENGNDRIDDTASWLEAGDYFFHVSGPDRPWPVVANFESWSFPHAQGVPSHWREAGDASSNSGRCGLSLQATATCRITEREHCQVKDSVTHLGRTVC